MGDNQKDQSERDGNIVEEVAENVSRGTGLIPSDSEDQEPQAEQSELEKDLSELEKVGENLSNSPDGDKAR